MRKKYSLNYSSDFVTKALQFANRESHVVYLNPNQYEYLYGPFLHVLAFGNFKEVIGRGIDDFNELTCFLQKEKDWAFGYLSYELKNQLENLVSSNDNQMIFSNLNFFIPKHLIFIESEQIVVHSMDNPIDLVDKITNEEIILKNYSNQKPIINSRITKDEYINSVNFLKEKIKQGDIYETNYCQDFFIEKIDLNPLETYQRLNSISPMPFSCYVKHNQNYLMCASPERFLKKEYSKLISQPIKGTIKRSESIEKDIELKNALLENSKERAENVMIVDIVRNDLSRSAKAGSVLVEEMCGVYSFPKVHQLISTVTAELDDSIHPVEAIKRAFPMGSMTGAPKFKAMQLIDEIEKSNRGLFSGSVGYITPELDFDFNVVIRSMLYNATSNYLSFKVGSAITFYSDAENEFQECSIKTKAILEVLT